MAEPRISLFFPLFDNSDTRSFTVRSPSLERCKILDKVNELLPLWPRFFAKLIRRFAKY